MDSSQKDMNKKEKLISALVDGGYLKSPAIVDAFREVDRADFVCPEYYQEAYEDYALPIGHEQTISQPLTVAFMLELLQPKAGEKILDIGFGSGWTTALLAKIVGPEGMVFGVERVPEIFKFGDGNIKKYEFLAGGRVQIFCEDGSYGLPQFAPFDKILAGASAEDTIPKAWEVQTKVGGVIVAPVKNSIRRLIKIGAKDWTEEEYDGFVFVPLVVGKII